MDILSPTHGEQVPKALNDPSGNLLRPAQMAEHYHDIQVAKADLENPRIQDKGAVRQRVSSLQKQYETQAPRPITNGATKDALAKEAETLLADILPGMLSKEEMRKNPAGSVDKYMRWERVKKPKILRWKKIMTVLNADESDPITWDRDAANLERFRPDGPQDRLRTDAQIGGHMTFGNVPDENWVQAFGTTHPDTSALAQAKRAQAREEPEGADRIGLDLPPPIVPMQRPQRKPLSDEQRRIMGENLARGRAAKKALMQEKGV
jgi:hypothetical protein